MTPLSVPGETPGKKPIIRAQVRTLLSGCPKLEVLGKVYREARDGYLPYEVGAICLGIDYALNTGRLPGWTEIRLRYLKPQDLGRLICDLYYEGLTVMGEVPEALIKRFESET